MNAVRIDKREARRRFNAGGMIAVSETGDHETISAWLHADSAWLATFADLEQLNKDSVRHGSRLYWYAPDPATPQGDQTDDERMEREHCDHGTSWGVPCWACDQEGRVLCTSCDEPHA